jgi:hypothetical protein
MTSRPSRYQMRRHARRLTRDGYQPMMVINSGSDLPESANSPPSPSPQQPPKPRTPSTAPITARGHG